MTRPRCSPEPVDDECKTFLFVHDKIQEACLEALSQEEQIKLRSATGWALLNSEDVKESTIGVVIRNT